MSDSGKKRAPSNNKVKLANPNIKLKVNALFTYLDVISFFCTIAEPIPVSDKEEKITTTAFTAA